MKEKYFECKPNELCDGAHCCKSIETKLGAGLGDYIRLSKYTGEPMSQIWRTKGIADITSAKGTMRQGEFGINLGLLHDPCPYLSEDNKCSVYEVRPLDCGFFPLSLFVLHKDELEDTYAGYKCLQGVKPKPVQLMLGKELLKIMDEEVKLELDSFWGGKALRIYIPSVGDNSKLTVRAMDLMGKREYALHKERADKLLKAVQGLNRLFKTGEPIEARTYIHLLSPVIFTLMEDEIAKKLDNLDEHVIKLFNRTSKKWRKLASKIE
ncbi:YkgJ family cysteine cluster protein [Candidatus Woesearchaeota archaeon]|nr:YkgJ family cysteine cluster protein [Candidatus Woesearchaeota archaeon]